MKPINTQLAALALLAGALPLAAQTAQAPSTESKKEEVIELSPFMVSSSASDFGRYSSLESTSAGRVRLNIMDASQSVSVITSDMLQDVGAVRIMDATKYISGIGESTLPNAQDRTNVRGFQADGVTLDGFTMGGFLSIDPVLIDRIEVVKGPNSILAPQPTSPGGTMNSATKKPQFRDFGSFTISTGRYDANNISFDVNRAASSKLAVRFIGSMRDYDAYWDGAYMRSTTLMPEFTYKFSDKSQLTVQYIYTNWRAALYLGLPIDPSSGTTTKARLLAGVPRDLSVFNEDLYRTDRRHDFGLLYTGELFDKIQFRVAAHYRKSSQYGPQLNTNPASTGGTGGNRDPLTGNYVPGMQYLSVAPYTGSPITTQPTRIYARSGTNPRSDPRQFFLNNDYAYILENDSVKSTTLAGLAYTETRDYGNAAFNISAPNIDFDHYVPVAWTRGTLNFDNRFSSRFFQGYAAENLVLLNNRLILNAAVAKNYYRQRARNLVSGYFHGTGPSATLPAYGLVVKPYKDALALYYSYSEQSTSVGPTTNSAVNTNPLLQSSKQNEFGARFKLLADKLYFTVAHFDIKQDNFSVPNPANLTTPPPNPLLPALFSDRKAKGWEYEFRYNPNKNISIIGNYTHFKNRDPNGVEFRGTAEKSGAVLVSYRFDPEGNSALSGLRTAVGVDYVGNRPGDSASGLTPASTPTKIIPNQPSFYLGSRTLVNLTLAYESKKDWSVQVNVDNLFNTEYLMAGLTRGMVYPGYPVNFRASFTKKY
jgi:iron complex outermembrane receptor protein